ncbi:MAG: pilus assembly protein [Acidobacteriia bacterium]|nr:pilus assembly protein [Terriglobia bacterium]
MRNKSGKRGHAVIEVALMAPWIFFLFMGVFDFGFYAYAMVSVTNAARSAALYTSSGGAGSGLALKANFACVYVLEELRMMPNVGSSTSCVCSGTNCTAGPISLDTTAPNGPDGAPAAQVSVTYTSPQLFPIPGMTGLLTLTRTAVMKQ